MAHHLGIAVAVVLTAFDKQHPQAVRLGLSDPLQQAGGFARKHGSDNELDGANMELEVGVLAHVQVCAVCVMTVCVMVLTDHRYLVQRL